MVVPELAPAASALAQAELAEQPAQRFLNGHLAALRVAAVVLAHRTVPRRVSKGPRDVWQVLAEVAPEFAEWAGFFAASALKRRAVAAGATALVGTREADDLLRDVQLFFDQVAGRLKPARTDHSQELQAGGTWMPVDGTRKVKAAATTAAADPTEATNSTTRRVS